MSVSITKVAEEAGVSRATVSRVINKNPCVAVSTTKVVWQTIHRLGYRPPERRPGPKLGSRRQKRKMKVAFFVFASPKKDPPPAFQKMLQGISNALGGHNANLLFQISDDESLLDLLRNNRIDGLLAHGKMPSPAIQAALSEMPTVWLMANRNQPAWGDQVMPNSTIIGQYAAEYLAGRDRRELAFLNMWGKHRALQMYERAFYLVAQSLGVTVQTVSKAELGPPSYWGKHTAKLTESMIDELLTLSPLPDALFIADDLQASVIQPALIRRGLKIGEGKHEVCVISCNNEQSYLAALQPRPVTIDIHAEVVGARAVDQLIWRINAQKKNEHPQRMCILIEPSIVMPDKLSLSG